MTVRLFSVGATLGLSIFTVALQFDFYILQSVSINVDHWGFVNCFHDFFKVGDLGKDVLQGGQVIRLQPLSVHFRVRDEQLLEENAQEGGKLLFKWLATFLNKALNSGVLAFERCNTVDREGARGNTAQELEPFNEVQTLVVDSTEDNLGKSLSLLSLNRHMPAGPFLK